MDEAVNQAHINVIEEAISRLTNEQPELNLIIEKVRESLVKVGECILQVWDKVKEFVRNIWQQFSQTITGVNPHIKYYGNQQKRMRYKDDLHSFLRTDKYQGNNTFSQSNIYHKSGKNNFRRRN